MYLSLPPPLLPPPSSSLPPPPPPHREGVSDEDAEHQLPKEKLLLLTSSQPVIDYVSACDYFLYQSIVDFLIPDVLRPIPGTLTQAIRNFAKSLEMWLTSTIQGYNPSLIKSKVCSYIPASVQGYNPSLIKSKVCSYIPASVKGSYSCFLQGFFPQTLSTLLRPALYCHVDMSFLNCLYVCTCMCVHSFCNCIYK